MLFEQKRKKKTIQYYYSLNLYKCCSKTFLWSILYLNGCFISTLPYNITISFVQRLQINDLNYYRGTITGFSDYMNHKEFRGKNSLVFNVINLIYSMDSVLRQSILLPAWTGLLQRITALSKLSNKCMYTSNNISI
jgi:hypothetical protein